jgi:hypothetical protein
VQQEADRAVVPDVRRGRRTRLHAELAHDRERRARLEDTLTFTRTSDDTCAKDVVFPELSIKKPLPLDVPVAVDVPSDAERTLTFQCGMAMYKSSLVVR